MFSEHSKNSSCARTNLCNILPKLLDFITKFSYWPQQPQHPLRLPCHSLKNQYTIIHKTVRMKSIQTFLYSTDNSNTLNKGQR